MPKTTEEIFTEHKKLIDNYNYSIHSGNTEKFNYLLENIRKKEERRWYSEAEHKAELKKIFDRFDTYACIKEDEWYLKLKSEILKEK